MNPGLFASAPLHGVRPSDHPRLQQEFTQSIAVRDGDAPILCTTQPPTPLNVVAGTAGSAVTFAWQGSPHAWTYQLEAGTGPGTSDIGVFDLPGSSHGLTVGGVPNGTYYVRVRGKSPCGVSAASNEVVFTVGPGCGGPPAAPGGFTAVAAGTTASIAWQAVAGATRYALEAGTASGLANIGVVDTGLATGLTVPGVPPGLYFVRARAGNACGLGAPSSEGVLVVGATCTAPPPAPVGLAAQVQGATVTLSWAATPGAASYVLEAGSAPGLADLVSSDIGPAHALNAPGVPSGTYHVRVRGRNVCGTGVPSADVVVTVP